MNETNGRLTLDGILSLSDAEKKERGLVHTPGEIRQQPATWLETFDIVNKAQDELSLFLRHSGLDAENSSRLSVWLVGAGTSDYIGRALAPLLKREWKCDVQAIPSTDLLTEMEDLMASAPDGTRHLWISFSRSGESFEGVGVINNALEKYPQVNHLIVTCNRVSRMATSVPEGRPNVYCLKLDEKVNDLGLAMTSSFTNMVIAGQCLAHINDLDRYRPIVEALAHAASAMLTDAANAAMTIASEPLTRICFLGSGALRTAGDESGLKVMELTAGHYSVMSESFLGLRHGPLSWLNGESLVVGFLSNYPGKSKIELGLLEELKKKNAAKSIFAILPRHDATVSRIADHGLSLNIPTWLHDNYRPPIDVLFGQFLGLFASIHQGLKPDTPSSDGKIQRVVSNINVI